MYIVTVAAPVRRVDPQLEVETAMQVMSFKVLQTYCAFKMHAVYQIICGALSLGVLWNPVKPVSKIFRDTCCMPVFAGAFKRVYLSIYNPGKSTIKALSAVLKGVEVQ